jgi:hypothetical protein
MRQKVRSIGLALLAAIFIAAGASSSYAQAGCDDTDAINALDAKIRANYVKNATLKDAIDAGKEFLEKFGACEAPKEFVDWLKAQMPKWDERYKKYKQGLDDAARFKRFDDGITGEKYDDVYAAGKEILAADPDNLNIMVPLGAIGLYQSYNKNYKYNDDAIRFAKTAIAKLKAGAVSKKPSGKFGAFQYEYTKDEAISELTYALAYINYWAKGAKKDALPFYYEASQLPGKYQTEPRVFASIGDYYIGEAAKLGTEIATMIEKQKAMTTDEEKEKIDVDIKAKVGLFNGYTERAIDALSRAHKVAATATAADKTYKDSLYDQITKLYKRRFDKDAGLNEYITATLAKPFPNPTSDVTPINDPEPTTTTTGSVPGVGAASGNGTGAASGNGVGAASGNGVGMAGKSTSTATTTKPAAPAPKKP